MFIAWRIRSGVIRHGRFDRTCNVPENATRKPTRKPNRKTSWNELEALATDSPTDFNFNRLGLKKLIITSYEGSPIVGKLLFTINDTHGQ
ncbi:MAG: hypothetical protein IT448_07500 [Phycisphaerales bacterium]|nr:hypothetical protein [Phycisphaerales bacterium]